MCDVKLFLEKEGNKKLLFESVKKIILENGSIIIKHGLGKKEVLKNHKLQEMNFENHEVIVNEA
jgi:hypothetical protein